MAVSAGLIVDAIRATDSKSIFVRVYATEDRLLREAMRIGQLFLLDRVALKEADIDENVRLQDLGLAFVPTKDVDEDEKGLHRPGSAPKPAAAGTVDEGRLRDTLSDGMLTASGGAVPERRKAAGRAPPKLSRKELAIPTRQHCCCGLSQSLGPYDSIYAPYRPEVDHEWAEVLKHKAGDAAADQPASSGAAAAASAAFGGTGGLPGSFYYRHRSTGSVLTNVDTLRLVAGIAEGPAADGGAGLGSMERYTKRGYFRAWFPGRHGRHEALLREEWRCCSWPCCQPLDRIRALYGSRIALYFAMVSFLTALMALPGVLGVAVFVNQVVNGSAGGTSVLWAPGFSMLLILLLTATVKFWRREEQRLALRWGLSGWRKVASLRPEFKLSADKSRSLVTGKPAYWQSPAWFRLRCGLSAGCTAVALGVVVLVTLLTFLARVGLAALERDGVIEPSWSGYASSVIGAVAINVVQYGFGWLAVCLTRVENHETDEGHNTSLVLKQGIFNGVNVRERETEACSGALAVACVCRCCGDGRRRVVFVALLSDACAGDVCPVLDGVCTEQSRPAV
jgi:hypothetical protein